MANSGSTPPKVFISYSHDSQEHKDRVLSLADRLTDMSIVHQLNEARHLEKEHCHETL